MLPINDVNAADVSLEAFMSAHEEAQQEIKQSYQRMVRELLTKYTKAGNPPSTEILEKVNQFLA